MPGTHLRLSKQELPADDKAKIVSLIGREVAWLTAVGSILLHPIHVALAHSYCKEAIDLVNLGVILVDPEVVDSRGNPTVEAELTTGILGCECCTR